MGNRLPDGVKRAEEHGLRGALGLTPGEETGLKENWAEVEQQCSPKKGLGQFHGELGV